MIEIIFEVGLYFLIVELGIRKYFYSRMLDCVNVKNALFLRKMYFVSVWMFSILYWGICLVFYLKYLANDVDGNSFNIKIYGLTFSIISAIQYWKQNKWNSPNGKIRHIFNISYMSLEKALKTKNGFILFLRGFEYDDYTDEYYLKRKNSFANFSEYHFVEAMNRYKCTYAVGMTKELEQPSGAKRVYLDDSTWHEGVVELMAKSKSIIILMNDKDSCIWEIEQSSNILDKTYFLVESPLKYENIKKRTKNIISFPELDYDKLPVLIHFEKDKIVKLPYRNSISNYEVITSRIVLEMYHFMSFKGINEQKLLNPTEMKIGIGTLLSLVFLYHRTSCFFILIVNLVVTIFLVSYIPKTTIEISVIVIFAFLSVIELLLFKVLYRKILGNNGKK